MAIDLSHVEILDSPDASRFEARYFGELLGYATYEVTANVMRLPHTYVAPAARGQSIAALLVQTALETARARRLRVVPICWYVEVFLRRHPEYLDLAADSADFTESS